MDPRGERVISTWRRSCQRVQTVPEFPELTCQNFRNPQIEHLRCCILVQLSPNCHERSPILLPRLSSTRDLCAYNAWLGDCRMSQQLLDCHYIHASIEQSGCECMSQRVPRNVGNSGLLASQRKASL